MDFHAFDQEDFISLKEIFPIHGHEPKPLAKYLKVSRSKDNSCYTAEFIKYQHGRFMEKSCFFPLYISDKPGNAQKANLNAIKIHDFEKMLSLTFVPEISQESNVCFATSNEVRPEYKTTFSSTDIFDYALAFLNAEKMQKACQEFWPNELPQIPYPKSSDNFWSLVGLGAKLRKAQAAKNHKSVEMILEEINSAIFKQ